MKPSGHFDLDWMERHREAGSTPVHSTGRFISQQTSDMNLVEKAKAISFTPKGKREITVDEVELAVAWLKGEVTTKQCEIATEKGGFETRVGRLLKDGYRRGIVMTK